MSLSAAFLSLLTSLLLLPAPCILKLKLSLASIPWLSFMQQVIRLSALQCEYSYCVLLPFSSLLWYLFHADRGAPTLGHRTAGQVLYSIMRMCTIHLYPYTCPLLLPTMYYVLYMYSISNPMLGSAMSWCMHTVKRGRTRVTCKSATCWDQPCRGSRCVRAEDCSRAVKRGTRMHAMPLVPTHAEAH